MKTIIKIFICLSLIYTPYFAFAGAAEKWTIEEVVYNNVGKTLSYTAEKNYGPAANDYKYKAKVPVSASVAGSTALSMFRYGLASAALYGLVEGVGWIIDNGVVKKKVEDDLPIPPNAPYYYRYFEFQDTIASVVCSQLYAKALARNDNGKANGNGFTCTTSSVNSLGQPIFDYSHTDVIGRVINHRLLPLSNPDYDPTYQPKYVPVTPDEMGQEIIDSPSAPQILPDIYSPNNPVPRPSPAPDATETALENAPPIPKTDPKGDSKKKPNKDTDGDGEPDTYDETLPDNGTEFKLPPACEWIPVVCEWYVEYKQDVKKAEAHAQETKNFWQSVKDWFDWTQDDFDLPEPEPNEIQEIEPPQLNENAISWSSSCPADVSIPISMQGVSSTLVFSWSPWCQLLSIIKPAIVASAYIGAAFIVLGLRT